MKYFLLATAIVCYFNSYSQVRNQLDSADHHLILKSGLVASSSSNVPFWMLGNNSQRLVSGMPTQIYSSIFAYKEGGNNKLDYHYGFEAIGNFNGNTRTQVIQSYIGINYDGFLLTLGKRERTTNSLFSEELGFGNLINGNNALPIPKIMIETNGWVKFPFLHKNLSYRGSFSHGWFEEDRYQSGAFLHEKSLHFSIHSTAKNIELQFGLTHNAQWGGQNLTAETRQPTGLMNFIRILTASSGGNDATGSDQLNALGNHLGTWDLNGKVRIGNWSLSNYWQFLWEDSSGLTPFNWRDGKVGITLKSSDHSSLVNTFNLEIIRTNDQDADKIGKDGIPIFEPDNFLNNSAYQYGWSYQGAVIGSPVFLLLDPEIASVSRIKNMVNAYSITLGGNISGLHYLFSFRNLTNGGTRFEKIEPKLSIKSAIFGLSAPIKNGSFMVKAEYDWGNYLGKNFGLQFEYSIDLFALNGIR